MSALGPGPHFIRRHPIVAGLGFALIFVPIFLAMSDADEKRPDALPVLFALAAVGGVAWGFMMKFLLDRRDR